jgi:hypothetical protein
MARCPRCQTQQNYLALLFVGDGGRLGCRQCGAALRTRVNEARRGPYALIAGSVAALLALSVVLSADFVVTVSLLLGWTLVSWGAYPLVLVLAPDDAPVLQSESK